MFRPGYLVLLVCVLVVVAGQVLFKAAAIRLRFDWALPLTTNLLTNWRPCALLSLALALYAASTVAWVMSLRTVPLSLAFMFNAISFVLVPMVGFLVFGEAIPRYFWLGSILITTGLALILVPGTKFD